VRSRPRGSSVGRDDDTVSSACLIPTAASQDDICNRWASRRSSASSVAESLDGERGSWCAHEGTRQGAAARACPRPEGRDAASVARWSGNDGRGARMKAVTRHPWLAAQGASTGARRPRRGSLDSPSRGAARVCPSGARRG
jgi:hypothetical protein